MVAVYFESENLINPTNLTGTIVVELGFFFFLRKKLNRFSFVRFFSRGNKKLDQLDATSRQSIWGISWGQGMK